MPNNDHSDIEVGASGAWYRKLLDMPNDSPAKAIVVTLIVSLLASVLVAGSAVLLRPTQVANRQLEQKNGSSKSWKAHHLSARGRAPSR